MEDGSILFLPEGAEATGDVPFEKIQYLNLISFNNNSSGMLLILHRIKDGDHVLPACFRDRNSGRG